MYKALIVDDEPSARNGIRDCIDWSKYNIKVAGDADDGTTALKIIKKEKPDIILTDVKMSQMHGIELAKEVRALYPDTKIIFISGYDDVDYIKSALKLKAIDYVLKPIDLVELEEVIKKVVNIIEEEDRQNDIILGMEKKLIESVPLLRDKFLKTLVFGDIEETRLIEDRIEFLNLDLTMDGKYCIMIIDIDDQVQLFKGMKEKDQQLISLSVINISKELIKIYYNGYVIEKERGEFVCIIQANETSDLFDIEKVAEHIQITLGNKLDLSISIGIGKIVDNLSLLMNSYYNANKALAQKLFVGKNQIFTLENDTETYNSDLNIDLKKEEKIKFLLKAGEKDEVINFINNMFNKLLDNRNLDIKQFQIICFQLIHITFSVLMELEITTNKNSINEGVLWNKLIETETLEDMKNIIVDHYKNVNMLLQENSNGSDNYTIQNIKSIIEEKYFENITVNDISKLVFLSTNYICMIFKRDTGTTINDYITRIRIEKAIEMLKDPGIKLYDICYAVGYSDPSYFSKVFKKYTGLSPKQYKENQVLT